uniref:Ly49-like N-terminal domain-containing protein n=1 Tax=Castor canadensis TaxID=51338 RepID=A0A8C1A0G3_CASCN
MSDQEVTYSTLRFLQSSPESQTRLRADATKNRRKSDGKEFSVPWHLITVTLGILCLLLFTTIHFTNYICCFDYIPDKHEQESLENFHQRCHILQENNGLLEQLLTNKSLECDSLKNTKKELGLFAMKKKSCCEKNKTASKSLEYTTCKHCDHWFCLGIKCYYFVLEFKDWKGCKQMCQSHRLSLLKIDDYDELVSWALTFIFILLDSLSHSWTTKY